MGFDYQVASIQSRQRSLVGMVDVSCKANIGIVCFASIRSVLILSAHMFTITLYAMQRAIQREQASLRACNMKPRAQHAYEYAY